LNRTSRYIVFFAIFALLLGINSTKTRAQNAAGRIIGNVTDPSGGSISGATVTVTNVATQISQQVTTDKDGFYQAIALPIGTYSVTVERDGFQRQIFENQALQINQSLRVDAKLSIGQKNETIEVKEQVGGIETVNHTIGGTVVGEAIQQAPLNGRNVLNLALMQPGVTETNPDNTSAGGFSIAGGRSDSVTYLLDGGVNNNLLDNSVVLNPNPDTIAEFRILESNYSAEYGRNGGGIISVVTKSGTNQWHGSGFDFLRNGALNANTFFNNLQGLPRDPLKRNQFGGTFGGPISIPHVVHGKDRFFFFVGYEGQRLTDTQATGNVQVFTPAELNGDFHTDPAVVSFLQTHPFFAVDNTTQPGVINTATFNPAAQQYITKGLIPSSPTGLFSGAGAASNNFNELTMKFDLLVTDKDKLTATVGGQRNPRLDPFTASGNTTFANVPGFAALTNLNSYFVNLGYTKTFSPNVLNELRFVTQRNFTDDGVAAVKLPTPADLGMAITPDNPSGPPDLDFNNTGTTIGGSVQGPTTLANNTFGASDTLSWVHRHHSWKFGGGVSAYQNNTVFDFNVNGTFTFTSGGGDPGAGNAFANFLLGIPTTYGQAPAAPSNIRSKATYGFAQDEWRIAKRLTLTLGVRYEYNQPKLDTQGRSFSVIPGQQSTRFVNAPVGLVFPGDKGAPVGSNFSDKNDWAPRVGFAWDPKGNGKTSIRGGFGIFYDVLKGEDNLQFNGQPPFFGNAGIVFNTVPVTQNSIVQYFNDPFGSTGTPNSFPSTPPASNIDFGAAGFLPFNNSGFLFFVDPHLRTPYTYQYNLSLQHELKRNLDMEVTYIGSSSHGLTSLVDINPFTLGTSDRVLNLTAGNTTCADASGLTTSGADPNNTCSFANIPEFKNVTKASYNALTASLTKQMGDVRYLGHLYFTFGYTFGHEIDNVSGFRQRSFQVPTFQPDLLRASGDSDVRQRITFSGGWDLPFDRMWNSGPKRLTQGWSLFPIVTWRTGFPLNIFANFADQFNPGSEGPSGAGDPTVVNANVVGPTNTLNPRANGNFWFNPNSFSNTRCGDPGAPAVCTPGSGIFPSDAQVVANPSLATYGSLPRNFLRGPGRVNFDLAVGKTTSLIGERLKMEFRAEFFNILNHAEFANPDTNIQDNNGGTFGQIIQTGDTGFPVDPKPRIIQLALRFTF
jgi:hypothetical protein